ncbi:MAG: YtxH domain-containing protein [Patescibacteria group bacterium]|nr:YtxH domain-containing protein [Patescibacteria group bacterium]
MSNNNSGESFVKGLFIGALGGAILGVLFAPDEGRETRRKLKEKGEEIQKKAEPFVEEARESVKKIAEDLETASGPAKEEAKKKLKDLEGEIAKTKKRFFKGV